MAKNFCQPLINTDGHRLQVFTINYLGLVHYPISSSNQGSELLEIQIVRMGWYKWFLMRRHPYIQHGSIVDGGLDEIA